MNQIIKLLAAVAVLLTTVSCAAFTEISSSTSSTTDSVTPDITVNSFIEKRYIAIRQDAANGGGENLDALAQLLGKQDRQAFARYMQADFERIFTDIKQPAEIFVRIDRSILNKGS